MTAEEIKALLSTPVALFLIMLAASLGSAWKQMVVARRGGTEVTVSGYFLKSWPETIAMLGHNAIAFVTLIFTDQLSWAAAIGLGYIANDAADAWTKDGRSAAIGLPKQGGYARVWMLLALAIGSALLLAGCGGTKALYDHAKTPPQYAKVVLLHHNAIGEQVADLRADPVVSESTKAALLEGYRTTVCSEAERTADTPTGSCMDGPAQQLEAAARAYEGLANAQTEGELQAAVDTVVSLLVKLINVVNGAK